MVDYGYDPDYGNVWDNHNAPVFHWCYKRMGELIPQLLSEGKQHGGAAAVCPHVGQALPHRRVDLELRAVQLGVDGLAEALDFRLGLVGPDLPLGDDEILGVQHDGRADHHARGNANALFDRHRRTPEAGITDPTAGSQ